MKKQWMLVTLVLAMALVCSMALPVMAERVISGGLDKISTETTATEAVQQRQIAGRQKSLSSTSEVAPQGKQLSDGTVNALIEKARKAFKDTFGVEVPQDCVVPSTTAYPEDGQLRYAMSMMPKGWEAETDVISKGPSRNYYFVMYANPNAGSKADILGLQIFRMGADAMSEEAVNPSDDQARIMREAARVFADQLGYQVKEPTSVDKVSGSFPVGAILTFDIGGGRVLCVTVSLEGEVSGYSFVAGKG